jgi:hypothetical protein
VSRRDWLFVVAFLLVGELLVMVGVITYGALVLGMI